MNATLYHRGSSAGGGQRWAEGFGMRLILQAAAAGGFHRDTALASAGS
jgi:hypothetical protein